MRNVAIINVGHIVPTIFMSLASISSIKYFYYIFIVICMLILLSLFDEIISLQFLHRLQIYQLRGVIAKVLVCNKPITVIFVHTSTII